jgi:hypothetical protein
MIYPWLYLCYLNLNIDLDEKIITSHPVFQAMANKKRDLDYAEAVYTTYCYEDLGDYPHSGRSENGN